MKRFQAADSAKITHYKTHDPQATKPNIDV